MWERHFRCHFFCVGLGERLVSGRFVSFACWHFRNHSNWTRLSDKNQWTAAPPEPFNNLYIIPIVVGVVVLAALVWYFYGRCMRSSKLFQLPVHRAIYENANPNTILDYIKQHGSTLMSKDYDGLTALSAAVACKSDGQVILKLLCLALPFDLVTGGNRIWWHLSITRTHFWS